jgi:hypothetical protein
MPVRRCRIAGILAGCLLLIAGLFVAVSYFGSWAALRAFIGGHSVHVFPSAVDLGERKAGTEVSVSFSVRNLRHRNLTSSELLTIVGQRASCLCVIGTEIPVAIQPRQTISIDVVVRLHEAQQPYESDNRVHAGRAKPPDVSPGQDHSSRVERTIRDDDGRRLDQTTTWPPTVRSLATSRRPPTRAVHQDNRTMRTQCMTWRLRQ